MAVVYFTSNASTGAGSFVEAIANAQPGDVIRPNESVFERGSTIEIVLASTLAINKTLTLDGGPYRVQLDGGDSTSCANITDSATVEFVGFDFVGSSGAAVTTTGDVTFDRCRIAGANGDGVAADGNAVTLKNSVVCGNNGAPVVAGSAVIDGSTVVGNVDALEVVDVIVNNSIVPGSPSVAPSQIGFVVAPPDDFSADAWTADAWKSWDLRLLDDASSSPSPYRDSGDVGEMSQYDLQGNFRGRKTNGVATCSPGAYETIQADLFWVGEPFPQTLIDLAPQNLVVSDFADTSETRATVLVAWTIPENASYSKIHWEYKVDDEPSFTLIYPLGGTLKKRTANVYIGSRYIVRICGVFADGRSTAWSYVEFSADASINDATGGGQLTGTMLPSALSVVNPSFLTSDGWAASRFSTSFGDTAPQVGQKLFVGSEAVFVDTPAQGSSLNIGGYAIVSTGTGGTEPIDTTIGFGATFTISMPVTMQRVGGFVEFNWTSGNVTVNADLTMSVLSVPSGVSVTVNGVFVSIETLRVNSSSTVVFSSVDAVLAVTETATVGAATFTGTGYFATPPDTDTSSASFAETVRACDYGADASSFSASPDTITTALLSWVKQNSTPSVLIEEANGSAWNVVSNKAAGDSLSVDISVPKTFRLFDGENFFTASARPYGTAYELAEEQTIGYLKTLISTGYLN